MPGCPWLTMNTNVNYVGYGSLMAVGYSHSVLFHNYDFQDTFFFFFFNHVFVWWRWASIETTLALYIERSSY